MNPDNPYAAPQSTEFQVDEVPGPVQRLGMPRRRFPELDTAELQRLLKWSNALMSMTLVWMFALSATVIGLLWLLLRWSTTGQLQPYTLGTLGLTAAFGSRVWSGTARKIWMRPWSLFTDCLALVSAVLVILTVLYYYWLGELNAGFMAGAVFFTSIVGVFAWKSLQAQLHCQELYNNPGYQHELLMQEQSYRKHHGIE